MGLTVNIGSDGRISPSGTNVIIPNRNAGVGDIVIMNANRDIKVISCGTYSAASLPTGYVAYGVIYGFVNRMARIVALTEVSRRWTMAASDAGSEASSGSDNVNGGYPVAGSTVGGGENMMRNGKKYYHVGMNMNSLMQNSYTGGSTIDHPSGAWGPEAVMSKANFEALTAGAGNAKDIYGTWENYIRQTMAVRNPGSVFAAHDSTHKIHEQGKWNTYLLGQYTKAAPDENTQGGTPCWYPAANYCFNYYVSGAGETAADHNWWLPSMEELLDLMTDEHWEKVNACGATTIANRANRWSSVRNSAVDAWYFNGNGFSSNGSVRGARAVRAVSLLKLV